LIENNFQGLEGQKVPEMSDEFVDSISERYIELYENITGDQFVRSDIANVMGRIEKNITEYINRL